MGYDVETSGRILLPAAAETTAVTVLEVRMAAADGGFAADHALDVDSVADLAPYVGARVERDGDWLLLRTAEAAAPWSAQATAFYRGLEGWATDGEVFVRGRDGVQWSYRYSPVGVTQVGTNGWDGSGNVPNPATPTPPAPPLAPAPTEDGGQPRSPALLGLLLVVGVLGILAVAWLASGIGG